MQLFPDRLVTGATPARLRKAAMKYRVQFLDGLDNIVHEIKADARSAGTALLRGASRAWPPHAMRVRVLDPYGHASVSKPWRAKAASGAA